MDAGTFVFRHRQGVEHVLPYLAVEQRHQRGVDLTVLAGEVGRNVTAGATGRSVGLGEKLRAVVVVRGRHSPDGYRQGE